MKYQNSILNFELTEGRADGRTDARTNKPKAICPFNSFQIWGHKNDMLSIMDA